MKIIIAGGRLFEERPGDRRFLDELHAKYRFTEVICGCARGADAFGAVWAEERGIPVRGCPPAWYRFGRTAGLIRNSEMAALADALIAFPGGRGTQDMIRKAKARGLPVYSP